MAYYCVGRDIKSYSGDCRCVLSSWDWAPSFVLHAPTFVATYTNCSILKGRLPLTLKFVRQFDILLQLLGTSTPHSRIVELCFWFPIRHLLHSIPFGKLLDPPLWTLLEAHPQTQSQQDCHLSPLRYSS